MGSDVLQGVPGLAALPFHQRLPQRPLRVHLGAQLADVVCKGQGSEQGTDTGSSVPAELLRFPRPQGSHPEPAEPPAGRGGTFVQQCRGQGCEVTKLKDKGGTGSGGCGGHGARPAPWHHQTIPTTLQRP